MTTAEAEEVLRHTPLYDRHVALGGKMVNFAGTELPIQYTSIMEEHAHVRSACGIFDVSHLGEIKVSGAGAFPFIQKMIPTDLGQVGNNGILYSIFLNRQGGVMDDILIYRLNVNAFYIVVNASGIEKGMKHLKSHAPANVHISNESDSVACIAIQGPKAAVVCDKVLASKPFPSKMKYYEFRPLPERGKTAWLSRTGYTGEDGFEVFSDNKTILKIWDDLVIQGKKLGARPVGLGARDTLRLEAGNILYGTDLNETITPFEARLKWLVSEDKPDFFGKKMLFERKAAGFRHHLCGFKVSGGDKAVPRDGYPLYTGSRKIGRVTSGSYSPTLKCGIGLGYVETALSAPGGAIEIEIHDRKVSAQIVKLPFVPWKHK
jgi:aminomethyltransferase